MNKGGCSSNCKIVPAEFLHLVAKCTLKFSNPVKSDHNLNFWYFQNYHIKTTKIFSVRSSPDPCSPLAGVTFSDSDSAPVTKFLNPDSGPLLFQIWESDSCSDSGYNHRSKCNLPIFLLEKWPHRLLLQRWSDSGFLLSNPILFLKNDIRIRSESCFG